FQGPKEPVPSVPGLIDLPSQSEVARQLGQLRFIQVLQVGDAVGSEAVLRLELLMALGSHQLAMLPQLVQRAIEHDDRARRLEAPPRFTQSSVIIGGVVQGGIEDRQIELAGGERQAIELGLNYREQAVF